MPLFILLAAVLAAVFCLMAPQPASAHDEIVGTDPAADSSVETLPAQMTFTFSGDLLDAEGTAQVQVTDPSGKVVTDGAPLVEGPVVTQKLTEGGPAGVYRVAWKVVSGDGHPIAGELSFTVTTGTEPTPDPTTAPTTEPTRAATAPPVTTAPTSQPADGGSPSPWLWVLIAAGALVIAAIIVWLVALSRRKSAGEGAAPDSAGPTER
ncbi:copper resistance CopC family protein [Microbacterium sp.]|uniref:copper resistance CopC family protein n=1 Tax=Microbacterium sp. TaxID=51671 RepID=UPI003342DDF4